MKKMIVSICLQILALLSFGHSSTTSTAVIQHNEDGWKLTLTYATYGIVNSLKAHYHDPDFELSMEEACLAKIEAYFKKQVSLQVNDGQALELGKLTVILTDHACEFEFSMDNMPSKVDKWVIRNESCKEINVRANILKFREPNKQDVRYLLSPQNKFQVTLVRDHLGVFRKTT